MGGENLSYRSETRQSSLIVCLNGIFVTAFHNGVLIQNDSVLSGETLYIGKPTYRPYTSAPIKLQAHGDPSPPLSFRNIWVRDLPETAK